MWYIYISNSTSLSYKKLRIDKWTLLQVIYQFKQPICLYINLNITVTLMGKPFMPINSLKLSVIEVIQCLVAE